MWHRHVRERAQAALTHLGGLQRAVPHKDASPIMPPLMGFSLVMVQVLPL